ncbi:hypothetical protein rpr22_0442 [Rickettsia prowazekii str. Rp22]|uniref:Uncharacterized protein n=1 Tax=Rickettsia prowazekii (strain Rp22) TaxID=449216 RepID=D5AX06_RICPP|nr:hypothetical protein rpr22_0442 [Rickettsia prowazekii str. Rp22]
MCIGLVIYCIQDQQYCIDSLDYLAKLCCNNVEIKSKNKK